MSVQSYQELTACSIDLKQCQEKLIECKQLAEIGEFTAAIVHEVRNPLTTIHLGLKYAQKVLQSDGDRQRIALALDELQRLTRLVDEILCYGKPQELQFSKFNLGDFIEQLFVQIQDLPEALDRSIDYERGFLEVEVRADRDRLKQVFLNLFRNSFEAIPPQETVKCSIIHGIRSGWILVRIHNGGTPIPLELLPQLATPFFSTKPSGTGLGLAISKRIILSHGGDLNVESTSEGTTVSVHLPIGIAT